MVEYTTIHNLKSHVVVHLDRIFLSLLFILTIPGSRRFDYDDRFSECQRLTLLDEIFSLLHHTVFDIFLLLPGETFTINALLLLTFHFVEQAPMIGSVIDAARA